MTIAVDQACATADAIVTATSDASVSIGEQIKLVDATERMLSRGSVNAAGYAICDSEACRRELVIASIILSPSVEQRHNDDQG